MANYIISFDADLLQSFWSPVQVMNAFGFTRRGKGIRGKIVQVESRYSVTAAKADEWIPVKPGTEGVLALGMAHFIIKEGLYDKNFVGKHTFGFEDRKGPFGAEHQGYKNLVLQNFSPIVVSEITGIPVESILRAAKEFATQGPSLAIGTRGDIYQQMAIHSLNALVGNIDKPGGILTVKNPPDLDLPAPESDDAARRGLQMISIAGGNGKFPLTDSTLSRFPERVVQGKPYDVSALFFYNCNPLFSHRHIEGFSQAMGKIPFIISFSPYMDETTLNADLVMPDHTPLEKWQSNFAYTFQGFPVVGIGKPVVAPRYNTRDTGDVIIGIAKAMGNPLARAFPWKDSQEALSAVMRKIYDMNKGDLFVPELEEGLLRELVRRGWRAPGYQNYEEFWAGVQEKGGWWDPAYSYEEWEMVFRTPSRKFEFYSQNLKNHLEKHGTSANNLQALKDSGIEAKGDQLFLPHWEPKANASPDSEKDYPFRLKIFQPLVFAGSLHANDPFLQDISGFYAKEKWNSWVEISPQAAEKLGIKNGDWVWLESPSAKLKFRAKLTLGSMPGVVNIPMGFGHRALGRWAKGIGENAGRLLTHYTEPFTGEPLLNKTRVKVYKA
jgi:anaerobic selenocysteine-containing dehydrogenase